MEFVVHTHTRGSSLGTCFWRSGTAPTATPWWFLAAVEAFCGSEVDVDVHTDGYTQWFYFAVKGGTLGSKVSFRLVNMAKCSSMFGEGAMRPVVWSQKSGRGWERGCSEVLDALIAHFQISGGLWQVRGGGEVHGSTVPRALKVRAVRGVCCPGVSKSNGSRCHSATPLNTTKTPCSSRAPMSEHPGRDGGL